MPALSITTVRTGSPAQRAADRYGEDRRDGPVQRPKQRRHRRLHVRNPDEARLEHEANRGEAYNAEQMRSICQLHASTCTSL
jgi:hypothetical protein